MRMQQQQYIFLYLCRSAADPLPPSPLPLLSQFVYVKSSFTPCPQETLGTLADSFGSVEGGTKRLTLQYALTPAWG